MGIVPPANHTSHASQNCSTFSNRPSTSRLPDSKHTIFNPRKSASGQQASLTLSIYYRSTATTNSHTESNSGNSALGAGTNAPDVTPRCEKEDLASFEEALLPHLDAAHNLARWLLRNEQDAQDVVQEAYLRAFKSFSGFHGSNGRAWLLTIVRNTSYTLLKKNRVVDFTTPFDEEIHAGHESVSPATILEHSEDAELIREAMDELPAEFREILVLRHQQGLSYKEIADIAQIPPGTVMSRLARARAKLKEYLAARIGKEI
jgi:RNA polymerase sigma-70 factor (ECF subfamily)